MAKLQIIFKDPDGVYDSITDAGHDFNELSDDVEAILDKFILYNEYVTIEFDTETLSAVVIPNV